MFDEGESSKKDEKATQVLLGKFSPVSTNLDTTVPLPGSKLSSNPSTGRDNEIGEDDDIDAFPEGIPIGCLIPKVPHMSTNDQHLMCTWIREILLLYKNLGSPLVTDVLCSTKAGVFELQTDEKSESEVSSVRSESENTSSNEHHYNLPPITQKTTRLIIAEKEAKLLF